MKSTKKNLILTVLLLSLLLSVVALDPVSVSAKVTMPAKSSVLVKNTANYITIDTEEKLQKVLNHEEIESRERDFGETKNYRF